MSNFARQKQRSSLQSSEHRLVSDVRVTSCVVYRANLDMRTIPDTVRHATKGANLAYVAGLGHDVVMSQYAAALLGNECLTIVM